MIHPHFKSYNNLAQSPTHVRALAHEFYKIKDTYFRLDNADEKAPEGVRDQDPQPGRIRLQKKVERYGLFMDLQYSTLAKGSLTLDPDTHEILSLSSSWSHQRIRSSLHYSVKQVGSTKVYQRSVYDDEDWLEDEMRVSRDGSISHRCLQGKSGLLGFLTPAWLRKWIHVRGQKSEELDVAKLESVYHNPSPSLPFLYQDPSGIWGEPRRQHGVILRSDLVYRDPEAYLYPVADHLQDSMAAAFANCPASLTPKQQREDAHRFGLFEKSNAVVAKPALDAYRELISAGKTREEAVKTIGEALASLRRDDLFQLSVGDYLSGYCALGVQAKALELGPRIDTYLVPGMMKASLAAFDALVLSGLTREEAALRLVSLLDQLKTTDSRLVVRELATAVRASVALGPAAEMLDVWGQFGLFLQPEILASVEGALKTLGLAGKRPQESAALVRGLLDKLKGRSATELAARLKESASLVLPKAPDRTEETDTEVSFGGIKIKKRKNPASS